MNQELSIKLRHARSGSRSTAPEQVMRGVTPDAAGRETPRTADHATPKSAAVTRLRVTCPPRADVLRRARFVNQLEREKRRTDRSKSPLSIALFRLAPNDGGDAAVDELVDVLCTRKRETDFVGCLDDTLVAVLLPDTSERGTQQFVHEIAEAIDTSRFAITVETYPDRPLSFRGDDSDGIGVAGSLVYEAGPATRCGSYFVKRSLDLAGASVGLLLLSPVMVAVMLAIAATSPGPVMYKQVRLGRGGKPFVFYKFRSMYRDADERVHREYVTSLIGRNAQAGAIQRPWSKLEADPRITPVGTFLRKTCLDELPQLFNVVRGELSLVGPRPPLPYEAAAYESWHLRRVLEVKPGITGLWQVEGGNMATFDDMVRMDLRYVRTWSLMLDLRILMKTVLLVLRRRGGG